MCCVPVREVEFSSTPRNLHSGVLDQHVQPTQPVHGSHGQRFDGLRHQAIKVNDPLRATQGSSNRGRHLPVNVRQDNLGACLRKRLCR